MKDGVDITLRWKGGRFGVDLGLPIDLSLPLKDQRSGDGASAWYVSRAVFEPVRADGFIGRVDEGGAVNFTNVNFNPHGHGTHTECLGHITAEAESIDRALRNSKDFCWIMPCLVITVVPEKKGEDLVITLGGLDGVEDLAVAVVLRTSPNDEEKKVRCWDNTNPPYLDSRFTAELVKRGVKHLLIDLPSVDKEVDGGELLSHRAFFGLPNSRREDATITEFIYVPNSVEDGLYALNLQVAPFELDAAPSRPVLFPLRDLDGKG